MTEVPTLEIRNLSIGYKRPIAEGLSLSLQKREFVTIMGENGSGKTTLIDTLIGLLPPLEGEILFWGKSNDGPARALINEQVGWVISQKENYPLFATINRYISAVAQTYPTWDWDLFHKLCREFSLDLNKKMNQLSLGEQSKVRLLKAICFKPSLIVLDELTSNLSPESKNAVVTSMIELFSDKDMTVLYVSHSKEEAVKLSDRIFRLEPNGLKLIGGQNV